MVDTTPPGHINYEYVIGLAPKCSQFECIGYAYINTHIWMTVSRSMLSLSALKWEKLTQSFALKKNKQSVLNLSKL
jgi:hypothetical protein